MLRRPLAAGVVTLLASVGLSTTAQAGISLDLRHRYNPTVTGNSVELYVDASSDCGTITEYAWDFGDGSARSVSHAVISHTWDTAGDYTVQVTVTDSCGDTQESSYVQTVAVDLAPNPTYVAAIADLTVYVDPSGTTDGDGFGRRGATGPYLYEWSWGDGSNDYSYADRSGGLISHEYAQAGTYTITMTAYDTAYNASDPLAASIAFGSAVTRWSFHEDTSHAVRYRGQWASQDCVRAACSPNQIVHVSRDRGSRALFHFTGTKGRVVATKSRLGGHARIYLDGVFQTRIDLDKRRGVRDGVVAYASPVLTSGKHVIKVKVVGDGKVALDGFYSRS